MYLNKSFAPSVYPGCEQGRRGTAQSSFLKQESIPSCNYSDISQKVEFDVQSVLMPTSPHIRCTNIYFSSQHFGRVSFFVPLAHSVQLNPPHSSRELTYIAKTGNNEVLNISTQYGITCEKLGR
jgi:hypothetical protein